MEFTKWQGCGNDFVIVDFLDREPVDFAALAVRMCDRHFGVGADGLMIVCSSETADIRMREFNPDGTEPEMCGNGIRCFARCLYDCGRIRREQFTIETIAGTMVPRILTESGEVTAVEVDMGEPVLAGDAIPVRGFGMEPVIAQPITVEDRTYAMTWDRSLRTIPHSRAGSIRSSSMCGIESMRGCAFGSAVRASRSPAGRGRARRLRRGCCAMCSTARQRSRSTAA